MLMNMSIARHSGTGCRDDFSEDLCCAAEVKLIILVGRAPIYPKQFTLGPLVAKSRMPLGMVQTLCHPESVGGFFFWNLNLAGRLDDELIDRDPDDDITPHIYLSLYSAVVPKPP